MGVSKELEEEAVGTADPDWSKLYSLLYNIMLSNKN